MDEGQDDFKKKKDTLTGQATLTNNWVEKLTWALRLGLYIHVKFTTFPLCEFLLGTNEGAETSYKLLFMIGGSLNK